MIRTFCPGDMKSVLDIWLTASIQAHHFVDSEFWRAQLDQMRNVYLPVSEVYVYENQKGVIGFYALYDNCLAAIFVYPAHQSMGIGKQLLNHAKERRETLELSVYKQNIPSLEFYRSQGFVVGGEQVDKHTGLAEVLMRWHR